MDHQRTTFYGMRQQVLEGRDVDQVIWGMIGDAIRDAVEKYVSNDYAASVMAEWARVNFEVTIDPGDLRGLTALGEIESYIKDQARNEGHEHHRDLGEIYRRSTEDRTAWE